MLVGEEARFNIFCDAVGCTVRVKKYPHRIVSLVPSITETLFDLGLEAEIVGRTNFCIRPREKALKVKRVGGTKDPNIDEIAALSPDLILLNAEENRPGDIEALSRHWPAYVSFPKKATEGIDLIREIGRLTGRERAAEAMALRAESEMKKARLDLQAKPEVRIAYLIWRNPYMTINGDTYISDMIQVCGGKNVFEDWPKRYFEIGIEDLKRASPDMILLPSEPYKFREKHAAELSTCKEILAVRENKVLLVQGDLFCWYGSRVVAAFGYLRSLLHPA